MAQFDVESFMDYFLEIFKAEFNTKIGEINTEKADGINIAWSFSPEVYQEKLERIDEFCEKS